MKEACQKRCNCARITTCLLLCLCFILFLLVVILDKKQTADRQKEEKFEMQRKLEQEKAEKLALEKALTAERAHHAKIVETVNSGNLTWKVCLKVISWISISWTMPIYY